MRGAMRNERGAVIWVSIVTAMIFGIAAYAALYLAMSQARRSAVFAQQPGARYLTEAAQMVTRARLWDDPTLCLSAAPVSIDTNGDSIGDTNVEVTITNCGAGNSHEIKTRVVY